MIRVGATAVLQSAEPAPQRDHVGALRAERRPIKPVLIALILLACVASTIVLSLSVLHARRVELANAEIFTANTAQSLAAQASSSFKMADTVLVALVDRLEGHDWTAREPERLRALLKRHVVELPAVQGLFLYDAQGRWIVNSASPRFDGMSSASRDYFQYHRDNSGREVRIGAPIIGRTSGVWVLPVSRRINAADGSFAGVALATIKVDYFRQIHGGLRIGDDGVIMMTLHSGVLLLGIPFDPATVGSNVSSDPMFAEQAQRGFVSRTTVIARDGQQYIYSYSPVSDYPLGVTVRRSQSEVLRPWAQGALFGFIALSLLVAGLLLLGSRVLRQVVLREHLEHELVTTKTELEAANSTLSTMAFVDGLTELYNRRYYEQVLEREYGSARRQATPIAVLMIDVDHFKSYNDHYGHLAGDDCLRLVAASVLAGMRRSGDVAARYGGEEFVVVLPDTDGAGALAVAETIRQHVAARRIAHAGVPLGVLTVSIGLYAGIAQEADGGAGFVAAADAALYRAKSHGRNCTVQGAGVSMSAT